MERNPSNTLPGPTYRFRPLGRRAAWLGREAPEPRPRQVRSPRASQTQQSIGFSWLSSLIIARIVACANARDRASAGNTGQKNASVDLGAMPADGFDAAAKNSGPRHVPVAALQGNGWTIHQ